MKCMYITELHFRMITTYISCVTPPVCQQGHSENSVVLSVYWYIDVYHICIGLDCLDIEYDAYKSVFSYGICFLKFTKILNITWGIYILYMMYKATQKISYSLLKVTVKCIKVFSIWIIYFNLSYIYHKNTLFRI